mmetsp:Transcript_2759/g.6465  ORF Transcript_2759/g.6465 Transcript_2759/m.6465 type:complete len:416 (-) Transcript_2759:73-1320(-)
MDEELKPFCGRRIARFIELGSCDPELHEKACDREYDLFVPASVCQHIDNHTYVGGVLPTVFAVHCQFCHANDMYHWETVATKYNFVLVVPHGYSDTFNGQQCCGQAVEKDIDDVAFFHDIIHDINDEFDFVSKDIVYGFGHKNGGFMVARAANLFRAIAPVGGYHVDLPKLKKPVGLFLHHGENDKEARITGCCAATLEDEERKNEQCTGGIENLLDTCTSAQDFVEDFGKHVNHCSRGTPETILEDERRKITCYQHSNCKANTTMCIHAVGGDFKPVKDRFPMTMEVADFFARDACFLSKGSAWVADDRLPECVCKDENSTAIYCLNEYHESSGFFANLSLGPMGDLPLYISLPVFLGTTLLMIIAMRRMRRKNAEEAKYKDFFKVSTVEMSEMGEDDEAGSPSKFRRPLSGNL